MMSQFIFSTLFVAAMLLFYRNARRIYRNIRLGGPINRSDQPKERLRTMLLVAFGQKKMFKKPVPALLHLLVYVGFLVVNIEMLEIVIDGVFGTHRILSVIGPAYDGLIYAFEILAVLVILGCVLFLVRRNLLPIKRLQQSELNRWPKTDANLILFAEILLMSAFLTMNAADFQLQQLELATYKVAGSFPVSSWLTPLLPDTPQLLIVVERFCWWFHIIGVLLFLNYLPISKHLHILLAFPNTYFSSLQPMGRFTNLSAVTAEVKLILDPTVTGDLDDAPARFGVKDVTDLSWKNLLDAYTCTECGRCTAACPANITGKLLSPRKIMMDTRDRLEEVSRQKRKQGAPDDNKPLLDDYISREEIWACTSCNACVEQCPVNINPLEIIMGLRQFAVMEESKAPSSIQAMFGNVENNGAPWKYAQADRANWRKV